MGSASLAAELKRSQRVQKVFHGVQGQPAPGRPRCVGSVRPPRRASERPKGGSRKGVNGKVNCGYLYDSMALERGKLKDRAGRADLHQAV